VTRNERILSAAVLGLLFACVCQAWERTHRAGLKAWYECGRSEKRLATILVDRPRCCVSPGVVVEGCEIKLAYEWKGQP
jgi:hypothetical protein